MRRKQTRFIRTLLYTLKKGYGFPITLHKVTGESLNMQTGKRTPTIVTQKVNKAIILPATAQLKFEYGGISPNFKYGALFDTSLRQVIIDAQDVVNFEIETDDYFIWDGERWQVAKVTNMEYGTGYTIIARMVEGSPRHMVECVNLESQIQLTSTVEEV